MALYRCQGCGHLANGGGSCETCGEEMSLEHLGDPNERSEDEMQESPGKAAEQEDDEWMFF